MEQLLSAEQVAEAWSVSVWTIRVMAREGSLACVRIGRTGSGHPRMAFRESDLEAYLSEHTN
jgi:hypothetical protein